MQYEWHKAAELKIPFIIFPLFSVDSSFTHKITLNSSVKSVKYNLTTVLIQNLLTIKNNTKVMEILQQEWSRRK